MSQPSAHGEVSHAAIAHRSAIETPRFTGRGRDILTTNGLKGLLWMMTIVGIPIASRYVYEWVVNHLELGDGTRFSFQGRTRSIYGFFAAMVGVNIIDRVGNNVLEYGLATIPLLWLASIAVFALVVQGLMGAVQLRVLRWFCDGLRTSTGAAVTCTAPEPEFVLRYVLVFVSIFTVIGWAWVIAAMARWLCAHLRCEGRVLSCRATGWEVLWRSIVGVLACLPIVSIPWVVAWFYRWGASRIEIRRLVVLAPAA